MRDFTDDLKTLIGQNEAERLNNIMYEVAKKIQGDVVAVTYNVIDAFYEDYSRANGRKYIRTDEYKHPHGKGGKFRRKKKSEWDSSRSKDVNLMSAVKRMENGEPAIGVCRPLDGMFGYQAGVIFDEESVASKMKHSVKGNDFTEWDIVEDFLWGVHGNESVYTTTPSAGLALYDYINSYKTRFDKHYKDACKKFNK
jgi:hypothetical protein